MKIQMKFKKNITNNEREVQNFLLENHTVN